MEGVVITCSYCKLRCHKTTAEYQPGILKGNYLELLYEYGKDGMNWYDFPHTEHCVGENVCCPRCGNGYRHEDVFAEVQEIIAYRKLHFASEGENETQESYEKEAPAAELSVREFYTENIHALNGEDDCTDACTYSADTAHHDHGAIDAAAPLLSDIERKIYDMTCEGTTQQKIAETCGMTLYSVRQIQKQLFTR